MAAGCLFFREGNGTHNNQKGDNSAAVDAPAGENRLAGRLLRVHEKSTPLVVGKIPTIVKACMKFFLNLHVVL